MAECCSNLRMTVLTFLETQQELQTTVLLQGSCCMKETQTMFQGLCLWRATAPMFPGAHATLQLNLMKLCLPTMRAGRKEKTPLSFKAFQEKAFDLSPCLWGRKRGSPRPSMHTGPVQRSHVRKAQAPRLLHVLIPE